MNNPPWTKEEEAAIEAMVDEVVRRINAGLCPECEAEPAYLRQVGQAMYAHPCGHRVGIGNARKNNEARGRVAPESAHSDPDCGLYSEWPD